MVGHVPPPLAWAPTDHSFRAPAWLHPARRTIRHLEALTKGQPGAASRPSDSHSRQSMALRPDDTSDRKAFASCYGRVAGQPLPPNSSRPPLRQLLNSLFCQFETTRNPKQRSKCGSERPFSTLIELRVWSLHNNYTTRHLQTHV